MKRLIPILQLRNNHLVKSKEFKQFKYIGDPINAVKIFNEKEVDELLILDIEQKNKINFQLLKKISEQSFMPLSYGGKIRKIDEIKKLFNTGFEKVCINYATIYDHELIKKSVEIFGMQSIVAMINIKKDVFGKYYVYDYSKKRKITKNINKFINKLVEIGVGELIINSVDRDGTLKGLDFELIKKINLNLPIPTIISGGLKNYKDALKCFKQTKCDGVAGGSMFVFYGPYNAVLITYPERG